VIGRRALFPPGGPDLAWFELAGAPEGPAAVVSAACTAPELRVGAPVWIVGFGAIDPQSAERPGALRAGLAAIQDPECTSLAAGCNRALGDGAEMIAGGDGVDACIGDSGGPLFLDVDGERVLIGVTSRGVLGQRDSCGGGGIFTRLDGLSRSDLGADPLSPRCAVAANAPAPAPTRLRVAPGERAAVQVDPGDADPGDRFVIEGMEASALGELTVDGLELRFAAGDEVGAEVLTFDVVDRAGQRGRGELTVAVGCACASTRAGAPWGIALVALAAASRRRGLDGKGGGGQEPWGRST
jgi:MYXO-CTERM domain-containing protein